MFKATSEREYSLFLKFLTTYAVKANHKREHDDVPDAMSLYKRFVDTTAMARVQPVKRIF